MNTRSSACALVACAAAAILPLATTAQAPQPNDYSDGSAWLCRPGRQDACSVDLATTIVRANGSRSHEEYEGDASAPVDCFYVYPTVSSDRTENSDMSPDEAELRVIEQQFARFGSVCRTYAPSYRQVTTMGLRTRMGPDGFVLDQGLAYQDALDAFRYYIENDNDGRGFVLIGHSQGAFILTRLIAGEIDGRPVQDRLVSAMLLGAAPLVARGQDAGGSFQSIPLCRSATQTGCVIAYSAYRSTEPPPENSLFGLPPSPDVTVACTNPAALGGGAGTLNSYLSANGSTIAGQRPATEWVAGAPAVETPFVSVPGLLQAECTSNEHASYLEITVNGDPADPRTDDIVGDLTPQWGLHLIDVNVAMGDLVSIVRQQGAAWRRGR